MAGHVVPLDSISVLVVQHGKARLVMELLQALDGDPNVVLSLDGSLLDPLIVVGLSNPSLSST